MFPQRVEPVCCTAGFMRWVCLLYRFNPLGIVCLYPPLVHGSLPRAQGRSSPTSSSSSSLRHWSNLQVGAPMSPPRVGSVV